MQGFSRKKEEVRGRFLLREGRDLSKSLYREGGDLCKVSLQRRKRFVQGFSIEKEDICLRVSREKEEICPRFRQKEGR